MGGSYGLPKDAISLANELQGVPCGVVKQDIGKEIKHNSAQSYSRRIIKQVNKEE